MTVRHMAPTLRDPDSLEICPTNAYFILFRWRPTCDHLVAHQPQPQSQYFPGIRNPLERDPTYGPNFVQTQIGLSTYVTLCPSQGRREGVT